MKSVKSIILVTSALAILASCVKKQKEKDDDTSSASENFLATGIANDMGNISDEAGRTQNISSFKTTGETALMTSCATLSFDTMNNAKTVTVDFGNSNCTCNDGRSRRGKLVITYSGKYRDSLTTIAISPVAYFVNDNGVSGSKTIKNLGHNSAGHLLYDINESLTIAKADGSGNISFTAHRQREWTAGEGTLVWVDDVYSITGTASGTNANGRSFTSVITKPLIRKMEIGCRRHFVSGVLEHTPAQKATRSLDFGNGTCDNQAVVTIDGRQYSVDLP
jgi:hypothetical protein